VLLEQTNMTEKGQNGVLKKFGWRIVRRREEKSWTRAELAGRLGVTRERLGHWERGENTPPLDVLVALGRELEVSLDELVTGEPAPDPQSAPANGLCRERKAEALRHLSALMRLVQ
jgi:transcriptional regulator with XRE-family HTH domain